MSGVAGLGHSGTAAHTHAPFLSFPSSAFPYFVLRPVICDTTHRTKAEDTHLFRTLAHAAAYLRTRMQHGAPAEEGEEEAEAREEPEGAQEGEKGAEAEPRIGTVFLMGGAQLYNLFLRSAASISTSTSTSLTTSSTPAISTSATDPSTSASESTSTSTSTDTTGGFSLERLLVTRIRQPHYPRCDTHLVEYRTRAQIRADAVTGAGSGEAEQRQQEQQQMEEGRGTGSGAPTAAVKSGEAEAEAAQESWRKAPHAELLAWLGEAGAPAEIRAGAEQARVRCAMRCRCGCARSMYELSIGQQKVSGPGTGWESQCSSLVLDIGKRECLVV